MSSNAFEEEKAALDDIAVVRLALLEEGVADPDFRYHDEIGRRFLRRAGVELSNLTEEVYTSLLGKPVTYHWRRKRPALPHEPYTYWLDDAEPGTPGAFPTMEVFVG